MRAFNVHSDIISDPNTPFQDFEWTASAGDIATGDYDYTSYDVCGTGFCSSGGSDSSIGTFSLETVLVTPVPEPNTYAMMAMGLAGLGIARKRKQKS